MRGFHESNDQFHLHAALREGGFESKVRALATEFNYGHGTVVKHFIRKPGAKEWGQATILNQREDRIEQVVAQLCSTHEHLCDDVARKVYAY